MTAPSSRQCLATVEEHGGAILSLCVLPEANLFATLPAMNEDTMFLWNARGEKEYEMQHNEEDLPVLCCVASEDFDIIYTGCKSGMVYAWDMQVRCAGRCPLLALPAVALAVPFPLSHTTLSYTTLPSNLRFARARGRGSRSRPWTGTSAARRSGVFLSTRTLGTFTPAATTRLRLCGRRYEDIRGISSSSSAADHPRAPLPLATWLHTTGP